MNRKITLIIICLSIAVLHPVSAADINQSSYVIGPGDTLEIHAWNKDNPDILIVNPVVTTGQGQTIVTTVAQDTHSVTVSRDGRIYVPLVGVIMVAGKTSGDLENLIKKGLKAYTLDAEVTVLIKNPKVVRVYVMGQVGRPGMYGVPDGAPEECRLINFVNLAGGFTPFAELNLITVKRGDQKFVVDFYKVEKEGDIGQNIILKDGDTIVVSQVFNQVYVLGYVIKPGAVRYIEGAKVADYIGSAGGFTRFAASDNIGIIRGDPANPVVIKVKVNKFLAWESDSDNPKILPGDVIYVPQSWFADWADMAGVLVGFRDARNASRDLMSGPQWDPSVNR
jgi:polysaccharide export outer membrane protein